MIRKILGGFAILGLSTVLFVHQAYSDWKPAEGSMLTPWGEKVTPENAWSQYPRPQLVRENWTNLNGLWDFKVSSNKATTAPKDFKQKILVPFAMETPLSGVGKRLKEDEVIWYKKTFNYTPTEGNRTLLNFEGVDYSCRVWVNGQVVGAHTGGNLPFSFDVTDAIKSGENTVTLRVMDDTDSNDRYQLRGKQKRNNGGIWYTPSSGIWATVWLEEVANSYLASIKTVADMHGKLSIAANIAGEDLSKFKVRASLFDKDKVIAKKTSSKANFSLKTKKIKLWTPDSPTLYDLKVELLNSKGQVIDSVDSYVGFRSVGKVKDEDGHWRFTLNKEEIFHWGPLDQGWWPDGFLNPPADEAIVFEMAYLKQAGFNMIRKHKKVEPRRYYYHADRLGFLIWQDQVSGGAGGTEWPKWKRLEMHGESFQPTPEKKGWWQGEGDPEEAIWPEWAHFQYMLELQIMIDTLHNNPSVVVWTTFNERWGQHRSMKVGEWTMNYDPTRQLNIASGGNFFPVGHIADHHKYPHPEFPFEVAKYNDYIKVMGEFGGHGWEVKGHEWDIKKKKKVYGNMPKSIEEYRTRYAHSIELLGDLKKKGISAGVYTQTTDVEIEINGLMTYDRKVIKISADYLKDLHKKHGLID